MRSIMGSLSRGGGGSVEAATPTPSVLRDVGRLILCDTYTSCAENKHEIITIFIIQKNAE